MSCVYVVRGLGTFPVDMLRYDASWPMGPDDAAKIEAALSDPMYDKRWEVTLTTARPFPTYGRWESFSCTVDVRDDDDGWDATGRGPEPMLDKP